MPRGHVSKEKRREQLVTRLRRINQKYRDTIAELKAIISQQNKRIKELEEKIQDKEAQRKQMLSYLYKPNQSSPSGKSRGKQPGAPAWHRPKPKEEDITERRTFSLNQCPACHGPVGDALDTVIKYEEDIDLAPHKIVKEYTITRHWCPRCETFMRSPNIPLISRIGLNVLGYLLYARYRLHLPMEKIKESLADLHNFQISMGEIAEKLQEAENLFGKDYQAIAELIKTAKIVYADETGWRMEGRNWWLWVFVTPKGVRYILTDTRGRGIPQEALGTNKDRVISSDGLAVYDKLPGEHQQCWVHLLRVAKQSSAAIYADLAQLYLKLGEELTKPLTVRNPRSFAEKLITISAKHYQDPLAQKVQQRIKKHQETLLTCMKYEGVLPENNTAERALRPQVVMRKIFGGCRSPDGAKAHEVNTSVLETLRVQHPDSSFFEMVLPLLEKRRDEHFKPDRSEL